MDPSVCGAQTSPDYTSIGQVWMPPAAPGMTLRPEELGKPVRPAVSAWNLRLDGNLGCRIIENMGDLFKPKAPHLLG